jgi:hypothetical protein
VYSVSREGQLQEVGQFAGHSQDVTCIAISSDGKFAISGGQEKKARFWEIENGREIAATPPFHGRVKAVHLARGGRTALATDGEVLLEFDVGKQQAKRQRPLTRSWAAGQAAAISADGEWVAAGDSYHIRVWNVQTGRELPALTGDDIPWSMAFTPDGSKLLSGSSSRVNVWDVRKGQRIHLQSTFNTGYVQSLAVSPDGKLYAAAGSPAGELQVFHIPRK